MDAMRDWWVSIRAEKHDGVKPARWCSAPVSARTWVDAASGRAAMDMALRLVPAEEMGRWDMVVSVYDVDPDTGVASGLPVGRHVI